MPTESTPATETMLFWRYISSTMDQLLATLDGLTAAEINWSPIGDANSLYVLATHTMGNITQNLLEVLCGQPVHRQRDAEFTAQGDTPDALHTQWQNLRVRIQEQLEQINDASLSQPRTHPARGQVSGRDILIVVARHSAEHMGQAFLTRDLILARR